MARWTAFIQRHPAVVGTIVLMTAWWAMAYLGALGKTLLASPLEVGMAVLDSLSADASEGVRVFAHAGGTIRRALTGWAIGIGVGSTLGIALGLARWWYRATEPMLEFVRAVPPILAFPLLLVVFNFGDQAYVWTIVFGALPVMVVTVARGVQRISQDRVEILRVYKVRGLTRVLTQVMEVLPSMFLGGRLTLSLSLVVAVVTEMVFTPRSRFALGSLAKDAEISFNTPLYYAAILLIGTFGYGANLLMRRVEDRIRGAADLDLV